MLQLPRQIWILALGRLLSEIGSGFTIFYAPIFFVQQVGLSATSVGLALGSASISGVAGRLISGTYADRWGRKPVLLLSTLVLALACFIFAATSNLSALVVGCLVQGLGLGLYWPANEAIVADLTDGEGRRFAYAITRLADNIGMGLGIIAGGLLISSTGAYRVLFIIDGVSFCCFFLTLVLGIKETLQAPKTAVRFFSGYTSALRDRRLLVYVTVNIILTIYISQTQSTLPLYFSQFVPQADARGFSPQVISTLFTGHLLMTIASQLPMLKLLGKFSQVRALMISGGFWILGFACMTMTGTSANYQLVWASLGLGLFALAIVAYTPTASALIADLAPSSLRGVYTSINSLCWAAGYAIGPPLGGWALDRSPQFAHNFWLGLAATVPVVWLILAWLERLVAGSDSP
ncbi:MDR family MFS transporter [Chamaesiphon minutus]|uniref:Na+/melibiose symporter-like transporter n=1 Tax=Chamaesiphon minutus (strain ATCC 27169 / PCC 6605) TaxID=1173020 RepID=K9UCC7_CHAP6|nr:MFS transporter [Chamaesiphon minutus]AFY91859.1 Na+/melibiose symporter-like transporter [Chamaesiphon minutus PCC 6605]